MNAVGPRAEMPEARTVRNKMIPGYDYRLSVRPGMAGWGMMHKYDDLKEKFQYDLYYIKYRSIRFDIYIVLETARRILMEELGVDEGKSDELIFRVPSRSKNTLK